MCDNGALMALAEFTVERYRSFVDPTTVRLRPITLFFGYNSAGKSSLTRLLPLIAASSSSARDTNSPLALDAYSARGAAFGDIRSRLSERNDLAFSLSWDDDDALVRRVEFHLREIFEERRHVVQDFRAEDSEGTLIEASYTPDEIGKSDYSVRVRGGDSAARKIIFRGLHPHSTDKVLDSHLAAVRSRLVNVSQGVHWLGAVRVPPPRKCLYRTAGRISPDGSNAAQVLAYDALTPQKNILSDVSLSFKESFEHSLDVVPLQDEFCLTLSPLGETSVRVPLIDAGEGAPQVLPVFVLTALAKHGALGFSSILALEHPELHLHPAAEAKLAQVLASVAKSESAPTLLLETHSENLLLWMQLAVVEERLDPSDIAIYWVRRLQDGRSTLDEIELNQLGEPTPRWPPGVFSEDVELARRLFLARRKRSR